MRPMKRSAPDKLQGVSKKRRLEEILERTLTNGYPSDVYINNKLLQEKQIMEYFSHEINNIPPIVNQRQSGRCWMYALMYPIRIEMIREFDLEKNFNFSTSLLLFWDKYEKLRTSLKMAVDLCETPLSSDEMRSVMYLSDGGFEDYFYRLIEVHGIVPKSAFVESKHSRNTRHLNHQLHRLLRNYIYWIRSADPDKREDLVEKGCKDGYKLLCYMLGTPPETITFKYMLNTEDDKSDEDKDEGEDHVLTERKFYQEELTPREFYHKYVEKYTDVVTLINDTHPDRPYGKMYKGCRLYRSIYEAPARRYLNLRMCNIKEYIKKAIQQGIPVPIMCNISAGNYCHGKRGILDPDMYHPELIMKSLAQGYDHPKHVQAEYGFSHTNHICVVVGYDEHRKTWKIANSWGSGSGSGGYWEATDQWVDLFVESIVTYRSNLSKRHTKAWKKPPYYTYTKDDYIV